MRLDSTQQAALKLAFQNLNKEDEVYLFGSRVDDNKKGGDIDLLIFSAKDSFELSRKISQEFFKHCEEKIDVLVVHPQNQTQEQKLFTSSLKKVPLKLL
ncbi:nucleotidyltransferase domain-containing protein [sulfur-oxidizing endosymbiont of Gigantopelta aegis]|uniref:nucleotidyltransferase domain-containing protein n=1 Tax=sulfur-oxidizing endosymbiont of Gigantopelta aegis TaxID=2794934 RepID=UPI0018DB6CEF|nr:nucleotidyltransferase domain-containing protein [sulfur-oxidizing endosymbiont of Gigantopelta aegis]